MYGQGITVTENFIHKISQSQTVLWSRSATRLGYCFIMGYRYKLISYYIKWKSNDKSFSSKITIILSEIILLTKILILKIIRKTVKYIVTDIF